MTATPGAMTGAAALPWRVVSVSVLTVSVGLLPGFLPGVLAVRMADDVDIAIVGVGIVVGVFFSVSALASPVMGRVAENVSWARSMRLSMSGAALTLAFTALLADSVLTLALISVIGGVALALGQPATNLALARCTLMGRQGLAYGFRHAAVPAALALSGIALPAVALPLGWRWVYVITAALAVLTVLLIPLHPTRYELSEAPTDGPATSGRLTTPMSLLVLLAVAAALGMIGTAFVTFLVLYSVDVGFSEASAGILLAVGSLLGMSMRLVAGWQIDRRAAGGLPTVAGFLVLGAVGLVVVGIGVPPLVVVGSLVAFAFGLGWAGLFTFAVVRANPLAPAASTAITQTGRFVGAAVGPPLFGLLAEGISFEVAWGSMALALAVAGGLMRYVSGRISG
ncbi:MAG: MFS transporter [Acidimicrobiia bacterium]